MLGRIAALDPRRALPYVKAWPRAGILFAFAIPSILTFLYLYLHLRVATPLSPLSRVPVFSLVGISREKACDGIQTGVAIDSPNATAPSSSSSNTVEGEIPNIVHYVWLLRDPHVFRLSFKVFVSAYSSHYYFRPERIYIHTDASPDVFERARTSDDIWTRRVLSLPGVTYRHAVAPVVTSKGVNIINMEHKADFVRIEALREFGGIYMDTDAIPLRDVAPLRRTGFANVVGGGVVLTIEHTGFVNNGVMLARPHSILMGIWFEAAHQVFTGQWETASIHLLSDLAFRLNAVPAEVLVLNPRAFSPVSWEYEGVRELFQPHPRRQLRSAAVVDPALLLNGTAAAAHDDQLRASAATTCLDAIAYVRERDAAGAHEPWETDFSSTYILHAFDDEVPHIPNWDHVVDLKYILRRRSNYARAVYPAIWHAVEHGVIPAEEAR